MPINRVIVNASPLICLEKSGLIDLLPALFKEIAVPEEVCREIQTKGNIKFRNPNCYKRDGLGEFDSGT